MMDAAEKKSRTGVVIVESHQHALEHLHSVIRKRKIFKSWSMLHFDAHPDLACPRVPAAACFTPRQPEIWAHEASANNEEEDEKDLYELLDSTSSGIAEWILPLALAASLRKVEWVRPSFATQLPVGNHRFQVGAHDNEKNPSEVQSFMDLSPTARLKVDWNHPYYLDDDSVVPTKTLCLSQTLDLIVSQLPDNQSKEARKGKDPWTLDICLDYFACLNPFVQDIEQMDPHFAKAVGDLILHSRCHTPCDKSPTPTYRQDLLNFRELLTNLLQSSPYFSKSSGAVEQISSFYDSTETAEVLIQALIDSKPESPKLISLAVEALPYWNMPHNPSSASPSHIAESIHQVEHELQRHESMPFLITIARSTNDGFTPITVVEDLQNQVLEMLQNVYCKCEVSSSGADCCCLQIVRDYGEWEGSTL
jgi:hypothetical protein